MKILCENVAQNHIFNHMPQFNNSYVLFYQKELIEIWSILQTLLTLHIIYIQIDI